MDDLFTPPGARWQRVSPRLAVLRRSLLGGVLTVAALVLLVLRLVGLLGTGLLVAGFTGLTLLLGYGWWLIGRNASRWGYAELEEELYITHGALFRRLVVVPYGRMQYVDVQAGPLAQLNHVATVELHTASPGTSATIPGLPAEEAARLRDRLTALGESRAAGL